MTFLQALAEMKDGEFIGCDHWGNDYFLYLSKGYLINHADHTGDLDISRNDYLSDKWIILSPVSLPDNTCWIDDKPYTVRKQ